ALKSTSGWSSYEGSCGNGTDAFGFSALPASYRDDSWLYHGGDKAYFWSSTEDNIYHAYYMYLSYGNDGAFLSNNGKSFGFSVRCVKD
ncbi:MAG: FISUMP domain-containing protein, partial [Fibrobacter sp.]|nr:FISUMP domain-containing protein [Fibrobacter sp.]